MKYRLRFLLQEIDLPHGSTFLGRDSACEVTLDDPLVSRRHARIDVDDTSVQITDLESRNGVRINGVRTSSATLQDRDRIRLGRDEIVLIATSADSAKRLRPEKATRDMSVCSECGGVYAHTCPACAAHRSV